MKKIYSLLFLALSLFLFGQYSQYNPNNNPFNNSNRSPYEDLSRKKEREINQDMENVKKVINQTGGIINHFQNENNENEEEQKGSFSSGPGAPGEPVPVDENIILLILIASGILISYAKKINIHY